MITTRTWMMILRKEESSLALCPRLEVPHEEYDEWCRPWKMSLLVRLLCKTVGSLFMKNRLEKLWRRKANLKVTDLENWFFAFSFNSQDDYLYSFQEGPWMITNNTSWCRERGQLSILWTWMKCIKSQRGYGHSKDICTAKTVREEPKQLED
ncbi:uncharacterized protein G2W53_016430 [Senna tora]|uniref:DUF4283 domain-containing protein n=1 Tax=Senna tora TaxID=362788 RepID=A0A834TQI8_9FABA|nr:uncharacterized protein G2W53_016430 [Senna tora]